MQKSDNYQKIDPNLSSISSLLLFLLVINCLFFLNMHKSLINFMLK